jgi:hypothetical protein
MEYAMIILVGLPILMGITLLISDYLEKNQ